MYSCNVSSLGRVDALQRDVSSQYGDGLFIQQKDSSGKIYNVCMLDPKNTGNDFCSVLFRSCAGLTQHL